jgi:hypothetical protein
MGVYIFRSRHAPFIKVGHYSGQNAWSRVAHRGFSSCVCPREIQEKVAVDDVELLSWFPNLTKKDEASVKRRWKEQRIYGKSEWFPEALLEEVRAFLVGLGGGEDCAAMCDREEAKKTRRRL